MKNNTLSKHINPFVYSTLFLYHTTDTLQQVQYPALIKSQRRKKVLQARIKLLLFPAVSKCLYWSGLCVSVVLAELRSCYTIHCLKRQGALAPPASRDATLHIVDWVTNTSSEPPPSPRGGVKVCVSQRGRSKNKRILWVQSFEGSCQTWLFFSNPVFGIILHCYGMLFHTQTDTHTMRCQSLICNFIRSPFIHVTNIPTRRTAANVNCLWLFIPPLQKSSPAGQSKLMLNKFLVICVPAVVQHLA